MPSATEPPQVQLATGAAARLAARDGVHTSNTAGLAPGYLQANLLVLPSKYADDFRRLCARNPVPCPLLAESASLGRWDVVTSKLRGVEGERLVGKAFDVRRDIPRYNVYRDGQLAREGVPDIVDEWTHDHVAFLIGCSFSFEAELAAAGLPPRHFQLGCSCPIYRTNIPLLPAGVFTGATYLVSMRPYPRSAIDAVRKITARYGSTHGEPVAWGWDALAKLGIADVDRPEWGDVSRTVDGRLLGEVWGNEDDVPVFWGCGVTPQEAVMRAQLPGVIMGHMPGHMLVLDAGDGDVAD